MIAPATMQSEAMRRSGAIQTTLVLTAHGSADPRSAANTRAVARQVTRLRPGLDVRVAFCEHNSPGLVEVLNACAGEAVVTPLLLADAYHARVDIPAQIADSSVRDRIRQARVLGEDDRLISVARRRVVESGFSGLDDSLGVLVVAIGSSNEAANARTAAVAPRLAAGTRWAAVSTAFATHREPSLAEAVQRLRDGGARRVVIAPWFLAPGRIPDRVQRFAAEAGIGMAAPLGAHPLVAETVLDRFDEVTRERAAA